MIELTVLGFNDVRTWCNNRKYLCTCKINDVRTWRNNQKYLRNRLGLLLPDKYESIFDVSSKGPSSGSLANILKYQLFTKLPDEGPLLETSKILSYFSGRSKPNLLRRYLRSLYLHWQLLFMIITRNTYPYLDLMMYVHGGGC